MTKALSAGMILAKNRLDPQTPWLELYQLEVSVSSAHTEYLTNHPRRVVYQGNEYVPYPIRHEEIREEAHGRLQKVTVVVANVFREAQAFLEEHDGLRGRTVRLILVNLGDLTLGDIRQTYKIETANADEKFVTLILGKTLSLESRFPGRLINRDLFPALPQV